MNRSSIFTICLPILLSLLGGCSGDGNPIGPITDSNPDRVDNAFFANNVTQVFPTAEDPDDVYHDVDSAVFVWGSSDQPVEYNGTHWRGFLRR